MNQDLTTLARFKKWYNTPETSTQDDSLLSDLISSASNDILVYLDRKSMFKNVFPDYYDGTGGNKILLRQWPVISVNSLTVNALPIAAAVQPNTGYFLDPWDGFLPGRQQYINYIGGSYNGNGFYRDSYGGAFFQRGVKNIYVNYTAGYAVQNEPATIPTAPYQITAAQPLGTWGQDDGVTKQSDGTPFIKVTSAPATGQYSVDAGIYTFAAADAGTLVYLNYSYVPKSIEQACFLMVGETYAYRQRIGEKSHTVAGNTTVSFDNSIITPAIMKKLQPFMRMVPY